MAIVNLAEEDNLVELLLFGPDGVSSPPGIVNGPRTTLAPGEHRAFFLSQFCGLENALCPGGEDGLSGIDFEATLLVVAARPVAVTALRTVRGLPVSSLTPGGFHR